MGQVGKGLARLSGRQKVLYGLLIALSLGLFAQRYIPNVVMYHTPTPECDQVLGRDQCWGYGPWRRNQVFAMVKDASFTPQPHNYTYIWIRHMAGTLIFSLNGPDGHYAVGQPLILMRVAIVFFGIIGSILTIWYSRQLLRDPFMQLISTVTIIYLITLWTQNYADHVHLGQYVAIQGRYLLPILAWIYLAYIKAYGLALHRRLAKRQALGGFLVLCLVLSGGAITFVLRSNNAWYWPNATVQTVNNHTRWVFDFLRAGSNGWPWKH
jgi:hypothetical protein